MRPLARALLGFAKVTSYLARGAAVIAAVLLTGMIAHTIVEIVLRSFFHTSTFALDEYIGYGLAAITALGAAHALEDGALIRVTLLLSRIKSRSRLGRVVEIVSCAVAVALIVFVIRYFVKSVLRNMSRGTVSETIMATPLWIPELIVVTGFIILTLRFLGLMAEAAVNHPIRQAAEADGDSIRMQGA